MAHRTMVARVWFDQAIYLQIIEKSTFVIIKPIMKSGTVIKAGFG